MSPSETSLSFPSLVLNSLTHQDFIPRSLSLLDAAGRFVELGKLKALGKMQGCFASNNMFVLFFLQLYVPKYDSHGFTDIHDNDDVT